MVKLEKIGTVRPKAACEISASPLGIGFEKLDRDVFDPEKAYEKLAKIGVKWVRIQSGWQRTEREKGVYDFAWIDSIVDNLIARGMTPWVCLCYGNDLYDERAASVFGAVGCPPIHTEEQRAAWRAYVGAFAAHFRGRVRHYEVWNEPNGQWCWKHGVNATELGEFTIDTAKAVKAADPDAYLIGGVSCAHDVAFLNRALQTGMGDWLDAVSHHEYTLTETDILEKTRAMRGLLDLYNPRLEIIQGESGSQSRSDGHGALRFADWTPRAQAKELLRHLVTDLAAGVKFTSYFSCMDMIEALRGEVGNKASYLDYGYFGVLGAEFDENGFSSGEYAPKPSYYALQSLAAIFAGHPMPVDPPVTFLRELPVKAWQPRDTEFAECVTAGFRLDSGAWLYAYWKNSDVTTGDFCGTVTLSASFRESLPVHLIDPMDGAVFALPGETCRISAHHNYKLPRFVIRDYPLFLLFGELPELS